MIIFDNRNLPTCKICGKRYLKYRDNYVVRGNGQCPDCDLIEAWGKAFSEYKEKLRKLMKDERLDVHGEVP